MPNIERLSAMEILDSRGLPTLRATCLFESGAAGVAAVPAGMAPGRAEAHELRDHDMSRYRGMGCRKAVALIGEEIAQALCGRSWSSQSELDVGLIQLDGTPSKSRLGANTLLAVSLAFARASAMERNLPLYAYFANLVGRQPEHLPNLTATLFTAAMYAHHEVAVQDVLIIPKGARTMDEAMAMLHEVYTCAEELTWSRYGMRPLTAPLGSLAPPFESVEEMLDCTLQAISDAQLRPGEDIAVGIDFASSGYYRDGAYRIGGAVLSTSDMVGKIRQWVADYHVVVVEDAMHEEDWQGWAALLAGLDQEVMVIGDDFLCTQPERIKRAIAANACNGVLIKLNQVGTLTEGADALRAARQAGWTIGVAARHGETEDNWSADLAIGWGAHHYRAGSLTGSERLSKYNRLLTIEHTDRLPLQRW